MSHIHAKAGLRISGENLDLEAITTNLGVQPTHVHRKGDLIRLKKHYPNDMWLLNSPLDEKKELDLHLKWLLRQLKPHFTYLKSLKEVAKIDIFCSYTSEGEQSGFSLSPEALSIFSVLEIRMELSLIALKSQSAQSHPA